MIPEKMVKINYENWRGETRWRLIIPTGELDFCNTEWHPETQWLFEAKDCEDGNIKDFALSGIKGWRPATKEEQDEYRY